MFKLLKKSYFWFIMVVVVTAIILLCNFSGRVVYEAQYDCTRNQQVISTIVFHKQGTAEIYDNNNPYEQRLFVNYVIDGNNVYLFNYGETSYSDKLTISNKFNLKQTIPNGDLEIQCLNSIIAFGIIMAINIIGCIGLTVDTVKTIKKHNESKKQQ